MNAIATKYERTGKTVELVGLNDSSAERHGRLAGELHSDWSGDPGLNRVHLRSRFGRIHSARDGYPVTGSEGGSLTTPRESVASDPKP